MFMILGGLRITHRAPSLDSLSRCVLANKAVSKTVALTGLPGSNPGTCANLMKW